MAEIRPFRGLRFDANVVGDLAAVMTPPYDVIDAAAQEEYYRRSPHNIIRLELGKQSPNDSPKDNRYTRAAACLREWLGTGVLKAEAAQAIYVYQQTFRHRGREVTRTGLLAELRLEEWRKGIVLPHEMTMAGPKLDRLQLMRATGSNFSPIFALYEDKRRLAADALAQIVTGPPAMAFDEDDGEHRVWVVVDRRLIEPIRAAVGAGPVYIADGHHRYETALFYRDERRAANASYRGDEAWNFVMTLLVDVDDPGLAVLPTHRLVNPRLGREDAADRYFAAEPFPGGLAPLLAEMERRAAAGTVFGSYGPAGRGFALLSPRERDELARLMPAEHDPAWRRLDVSVLHEVLLRQGFGLSEHDFEDEARVTYTRDEEAARRAVDAGSYQLAIFLNPTAVRQVLEVARAGEVMPHKSTYFHPKPLTGIVLNRLDDVIG